MNMAIWLSVGEKIDFICHGLVLYSKAPTYNA